MGFHTTVVCDRCGIAADCDNRQHAPKNWEEFEDFDAKTGEHSYYSFCPTCRKQYVFLLDRVDNFKYSLLNEFFSKEG